jgi:hypothetical protein
MAYVCNTHLLNIKHRTSTIKSLDNNPIKTLINFVPINPTNRESNTHQVLNKWKI